MSEREPTNAELLALINNSTERVLDRIGTIEARLSSDISALLDLMQGREEAIKENRDSARRAIDIGSSNTSVLTDLLKRVRQLEADVRELKEPKAS